MLFLEIFSFLFIIASFGFVTDVEASDTFVEIYDYSLTLNTSWNWKELILLINGNS